MSNFRIDSDRYHAMSAAGMRPFQHRYGNSANVQADAMMDGRNHFYSAGAMRYFGCRVAWCDIRHDGLLMVAVFSQHANHAGTAREWRFAVHDCSGYHLEADNHAGHRTRQAAERALAAFLATVKPGAVLREMVARRRQQLNHERAALARI